ncbi:hypothetical protein BJ994_000111 [Arthrobacter pigmenti]|uniref:Cytotoxic translational repressor of toxin-antitoxin stability system n=1 Tax=Arthrobacter pigmenti TaxID=271432 RepID=A0A846RMI1_9MICC|nr:cytotoxic translational repressor of toxin-antitoxin stability system [Arthrobacter pigmenti]NJC21035.1 hypothetical protein [Arthrobacter pigmenti]
MNAKGQKVRHHATYELVLHDGTVLRTRISRPVDRTTYGSSLWGAILKDQLRVTPDEFWSCVNEGVLPDRGAPAVPAEALPLELVHLLTKTAGLSESEVASLTKEEAVRIMNDHWASAPPQPDEP